MNGAVLAVVGNNNNFNHDNPIRRCLRRQRVFRARVDPMEKYNDVEIFKRFRFHRHVVYELVDVLEIYLKHPTNKSMALQPVLQVMIALRFFATGSLQIVAGDTVDVSTSTVCRCVRRVALALNSLKGNYIKFPIATHQLNIIKSRLYNIAEFPNVIGAVDGSLIRIAKPSENANEFICRKGWPAINLMIVASANNLITFSSVRWPGSVHDAKVFQSSTLNTIMEGGIKGILLGDSGYPCKRYLLTPYRRPTSHEEHVFNAKHSRTRVIVEMCLGVLKGRFRCLLIPLRNSKPERSAIVLQACIVLHNFGILRRDYYTLSDEERRIMNVHLRGHMCRRVENIVDQSGVAVRAHYTNMFNRNN